MYILLIILFFLFSCKENKIKNETKTMQKVDTLVISENIAIFSYLENKEIFENSKEYNLTNQDIKGIEVLLNNSIDDYNTQKNLNSVTSTEPDINLNNYKRQYIAVINSNNEKEVWINCTCDKKDDDWKKDILIVFDGGNCYFNLKINLTKKKIYDFMVNGYA